LLAPIRNRTKVIGILSIQSYTLNAYEQSDLNTLQALADHCGGALERLSAESALHQSEMLFHSVWENSVDGMRLTDQDGTIITVNEAFCRLVGVSRQELEGKSFTVIYADSQLPDRTLQKYRERFGSRVIEKQIERRLTLRNGNVVTFEDTNSFVELSGQPLCCSAFSATSLPKNGSKSNSANPRKWKPSASSPAASLTTSTISSPSSMDTPRS